MLNKDNFSVVPTIIQTGDGSNSLFSERYNQTFHSDKGAITESKHVFLRGTGIYDLLEQDSTMQINILEVGFGTSLNFLLTADVCLDKEITLSFTSLEHTLLSKETIASLNYDQHLENKNLYDSFLEFIGNTSTSTGTLNFVHENISLNILLGDALEQPLPPDTFDAIYQDAFSPDANPELWSESFLKKLNMSMKANAKLATYCVKGTVRRQFQALGFKVWKEAGPPNGKREMLVAQKNV